MAFLMPYLKQRWTDANGLPLAGGKIYTYAAGTSTPLATFTDQSGGTTNPNPVILNANGEASIWVSSASYKFVIKDSLDNTLNTIDDVQLIPSQSIDKTKLAADVAGKGLVQNVDGSLDINYDDTTVEVNADILRVKALGIDTAQIKDNAITTAKIADGSVTPAKLNLGTSNKGVAVVAANWTFSAGTAAGSALVSLVRSNNVTTMVSSSSTNMVVGQIITIASATTTSFNGAWMVIGGSGTTYTLWNPGPDATATLGLAYWNPSYNFIPKDATLSISSITRASNVVTVVTTTAGVKMKVGQKVVINSTAGSTVKFDGVFTVTSVPATNSFTYAQTGPNESGTVTTGNVVPLAGVALTVGSGKSALFRPVSGYYASGGTIFVGFTANMYKPVNGDFGGNLVNNYLSTAFFASSTGVSSTLSIAGYVVDANTAAHEALVVTSNTITNSSNNSFNGSMCSLGALDLDPVAGTYDYYLGITSSGSTVTISDLRLLANDF